MFYRMIGSRMYLHNNLLYSLFIILTFISCKFNNKSENEDNTSQVETLDNFAISQSKGQTFRLNQCGFSSSDDSNETFHASIVKEENIILPESYTDEQRGQLKGEVYSVLSKIPPSIVYQFFNRDGKIDLSLNPENNELWNTCKGSVDEEQFHERNLLLSCWNMQGGKPTIYINPFPNGTSYQGVQHALIRSFGYLLVDVFLRYEISPEAAQDQEGEKSHNYTITEQPNISENAAIFLENIGDALWIDVYGSKDPNPKNDPDRKYDLSQYQSLYNSSKKEEKMKYQRYVLAEAFDSYFCNDDTKKQMREDFGQTYCQMKGMYNSIKNSVLSSLEAVEQNEEGKSNALAELVKKYYENIAKDEEHDQCEGEESVDNEKAKSSSEGEVISFNLGKASEPTPSPVTQQQYYKGYTQGGYYGKGFIGGGVNVNGGVTTSGYGCHIGCAIGGLFGSIINGVGQLATNIVKGAVYTVQSAVNVATYPFKQVFAGINCGYRPYQGVYPVPVIGGPIYGRPTPYRPGKPNLYPQPCYPYQNYTKGGVGQNVVQQKYFNNYQSPVVIDQKGGSINCAPPERYVQNVTVASPYSREIEYQKALEQEREDRRLEQERMQRERDEWERERNRDAALSSDTPVANKKVKKNKFGSCGAIGGDHESVWSFLIFFILLLLPIILIIFNSKIKLQVQMK